MKTAIWTLFLLSPLLLANGRPERRPVVRHVTIEGMKFHPDVLQAKLGDTVIWKNNDIVPHTVTAQTDKSHPVFDSGMIKPGGEYKLKLKTAGDFTYKCRFHPVMTAHLKIQ